LTAATDVALVGYAEARLCSRVRAVLSDVVGATAVVDVEAMAAGVAEPVEVVEAEAVDRAGVVTAATERAGVWAVESRAVTTQAVRPTSATSIDGRIQLSRRARRR